MSFEENLWETSYTSTDSEEIDRIEKSYFQKIKSPGTLLHRPFSKIRHAIYN